MHLSCWLKAPSQEPVPWEGYHHKNNTMRSTQNITVLNILKTGEQIPLPKNPLSVKHKIYSPPYRPQSNGRIESFHYFLKACISKHITPQIEWDDVIPLACVAYNFLPNEHSKESPFFLMFGRDTILPLNKLLQPQVWYLGNDENILSMQALKNIYEVVAQNLKSCMCENNGIILTQFLLNLRKETWSSLKTTLLRPFNLAM